MHTASHLPAVLNEGNLYGGRKTSSVMFYKCVFIRVLILDFGKGPGHAVSVVARAAQWEAARRKFYNKKEKTGPSHPCASLQLTTTKRIEGSIVKAKAV